MLLLVSVGGCEGIGLKGGGGDEQPLVEVDWPFKPTQMRIHPFTAVTAVPGEAATTIEARLEFLDQMGDATKAVGQSRFELYLLPARGAVESGNRQLINSWEAPLITLDQNVGHYDPISRTYLFKLRLPQLLPTGTPLLLNAQFTDRAGRRLFARSELTLSEE